LVVKLRVADTAWLQRLILRLGGTATVLDPQDLGKQIAETAREALSAYDAPDPAFIRPFFTPQAGSPTEGEVGKG
jgi:hypothetical protein